MLHAVAVMNDSRIDLDSNIVERSMGREALTRKNAPFAGHDDGAEEWTIVTSLIGIFKLRGIRLKCRSIVRGDGSWAIAREACTSHQCAFQLLPPPPVLMDTKGFA